MAKERYQTRLGETYAAEVNEFVEEHSGSKAEAIRYLIRRGVDYERGRLSDPEADEEAVDWGMAIYQATGWLFHRGAAVLALGVCSLLLLHYLSFPTGTVFAELAVAAGVFGALFILFAALLAFVDLARVVGLSALRNLDALRTYARQRGPALIGLRRPPQSPERGG